MDVDVDVDMVDRRHMCTEKGIGETRSGRLFRMGFVLFCFVFILFFIFIYLYVTKYFTQEGRNNVLCFLLTPRIFTSAEIKTLLKKQMYMKDWGYIAHHPTRLEDKKGQNTHLKKPFPFRPFHGNHPFH